MNPGYDDLEIARRRANVAAALEAGWGYVRLAAHWDTSIVGTRAWCLRHISEDDCNALAENGRLSNHTRGCGLHDRLSLISMCRGAGWTDARIARGIGISRSGLCQWIKRNAPDGVDQALEDFREEEAA